MSPALAVLNQHSANASGWARERWAPKDLILTEGRAL